MREKEDIISYLRREREEEIAAIRREAEKEISALRKEAEERKRREIEAIQKWARARMSDVKKTHIGGAHMEIKKRILAAKRQLMEDVFAEVYRRIESMSREEYRDIIHRILTSPRVIETLDHIIRTVEMEDDTLTVGEFEEESQAKEEFEMDGENYVIYIHPAGEKSEEVIDQAFISNVEMVYREKGLRVTLRQGNSAGGRNHGAIVSMGPIEIDATLDGIMEAKKQDLEKMVGDILFSGE